MVINVDMLTVSMRMMLLKVRKRMRSNAIDGTVTLSAITTARHDALFSPFVLNDSVQPAGPVTVTCPNACRLNMMN
ncbi:uncharacterized [Tachysurus ichikawai]